MDDIDNGSGFRVFYRLGELIIKMRLSVIAAAVVLTAAAAWQLPRVQLDTSNEIWFVEGDPALDALNEFERLFRNDDFVYVVLGTDDFFQPHPVETFNQIAADIEAAVPYVLDVTWLGNAEFVEGRTDDIDIYDFLDDVPFTSKGLANVKSKALAEPVYRNTLLSPDGRTAGMLVEFEDYPTDRTDPRKEIAPAIRAVLAKPEYRGLELHAVGIPLFDYDFDLITATETARFMSVCLVVQALILFCVGRGLRGILVPILISAIAIVWTFAAIVIYGFTLNIFVVMLPVLLICVGIGDSMHLIAELHDQRDHGYGNREAIVRAMGTVGLPCLLTSLTTAAGFLSFLAARIKPFREMGVYAATGVVIALLLSYMLVPVFYRLQRRDDETPEKQLLPSSHRVQRNDVFDRLLSAVARTVIGHPRTIVGVFALLTLVATAGMLRIEIESATVQMLSPDIPVRRAYDFVDQTMGSSMSIEILLDTGTEAGIHEPGFLRRMDELDRYVRDHPLTTTSTSVLDIHRQMRRAFHENRPEYFTIPETREEASQYLLLYEMSGGADKDKLATYEYDVARLTARTRALDTRDTGRFLDDVKHFADTTFGDTVRISYTGMLTLLDALTDLIADGQRRSFAVAAVVISLIMMLVLRSVRLGLISMIPNVFPVLATLGFMGYAGIYLGVGLMTISAIIIGVAVDDTIHFFVRFRSEFERQGSYARAIETTLGSVGRPITFTTVTLTLGFSVLAFSDVSQIVKFGTLAGFAFTWALLADLLFAPAVMLLIKPLGPERSSQRGGAVAG